MARFALPALCFFLALGAARARADDLPPPSLGSGAVIPPPAPPPGSPGGEPEAQPALPVSSIPGKTQDSPKGVRMGDDTKDIYDQYDEYLDQQKVQQAADKKEDQRSMFPHENGSWQLGLNYTRNALTGYNFNWQPNSVPGSPSEYGSSQGGSLLVTWFPVHSLTFGRLGLGISGGGYWTTFTTATPASDGSGATVSTSASPQNIITYGARAVYEFDYVLGQLFVPFGEAGVDEVVIQGYNVVVGGTPVVSIPRRQLTSQYFGGGVHLNLNRLESSAASRALVNTGIRKFYLTYRAQERVGALQGLTHNLGLDFEF